MQAPELLRCTINWLILSAYSYHAKGFAKPLSKFVNPKGTRFASKLLGGALAEFGAPATVETAEWLAGNTGFEGGPHWTGEKDFEPEDIVIGGLTNLGVNKGIGRIAGQFISGLGKKVSRGRIPKPIRERLEGVKTPKERAEELIEDAKKTIETANLPESEAYQYVAKEGKNLPSVTDQQNAIDVLKIAEQADPNLNAQAKEAAESIRDANQKYVDYHKERINKLEAELNGAGIQHDIGAIGKEEYKKIKENLNKKIDRSKETLIESAEDVKKATKRIEELQYGVKEYIATLQLGATTPSFDLETEVDAEYPTEHITEELVKETLNKFIGEIQQIPPTYSAIKINGKRAYEYARKGDDVELKPKTLVIDEIELLEYNMPEIVVRVVCSKGTYIRALARDIGEALQSGGHLTALRRTQIGDIRVENCQQYDDFVNNINNITNE